MKNIGISLADPLAPDLAGTPCNSAAVLGVIIEGEPHPPITHIGPTVRAPNDTPEDLVVCIVSASAGETVLKNYRSNVRDVLRRIKGRSSRIDFIHYRSRPVGILLWTDVSRGPAAALAAGAEAAAEVVVAP